MFSNKKRVFICEDCGHEFTVEKQVVPLHIFVSYGRDKYTALAERLKTDLEARGHVVWFDKERLKEGADWEGYIEDGLKSVAAGTIYPNPETGVEEIKPGKVVFLMTPHSVRRPDGYCLNEIAQALMRNLRIIPVMVYISEPPLSICRIQWLDMQDCFPPDEKQAPYERKLDRLLKALEEDMLDFEGFQLNLKRSLNPIEFRADILSFLDRFTGRQWVFRKIDEWLCAEDAPKVFWISGAPGMGKSAIAAWLRENRREVGAFHFCNISDREKSDPAKMVTSVAYQLSTQIPAYEHQLRHLDLEGIVKEYKDAITLFDKLIVQPITANFPPPDRPIVILIDALDEASQDGRNEIASFIAQEFHKTPQWLRMIITSRPDPEVTFPLQALSPYVLNASSDENLSDLREYLLGELSQHLKVEHDTEQAIGDILSKSEGSFLYAKMVCAEIRANRLSINRVGEFPQGLGGLYARVFERKFKDCLQEYNGKVRPALRVILASYEPMHTGLLKALFGWNLEELAEFLKLVGSLFPVTGKSDEGIIQPFHRSVQDWITDVARAGDYIVDLADGHRMLADFGWQDYKKDVSTLNPYFIAYLPDHLRQIGRIDDLGHLLSDIKYFKRAWSLIQLRIIQHWAYLEDKTSYRMVEAYRSVLDKPDNSEEETVFNIADLLRDSCYPQEEIVLREYLMALNKRQNDAPELIQALIDLGKCKRHVGKTREAIEHYLEAKALGEETGYDSLMDDSVYEIGDLYSNIGKFVKAEEVFIPLITHYRERKNWTLLARTTRKLMLVYRTEGKYGEAMELGNVELQSVTGQKVPEAEAEILMAISACAREMKQKEQAMLAVDQALHLIEAIPKASMNRNILRLHGEVMMEKARHFGAAEAIEEAFELRKNAFSLFEEIRDYRQMRLAILAQSDYYQFQGDFDSYIANSRKQQILAQRTGSLHDIQASLHNIGFGHQLKGEYQEALKYYEECLQICNKAELKSDVTRGNIADIYRFTGKFDASIRIYEKLCEEAIKDGNSDRAARCYRFLFLSCFLKGTIRQAKDYADLYKQYTVLKYRDHLTYPNAYVFFLRYLSLMKTEEDHFEEAIALIEDMKSHYPDLFWKKQIDIVDTLTYIALVHIHQGDIHSALDILNRYEEYWRGLSVRVAKGRYLHTLSLLRLLQERYEEAFGLCAEAYDLFCQFNNHHQGMSSLLLSRICLKLDDVSKARLSLLTAQNKFSEYGQFHHLAESKVIEGQLVMAETQDKDKAATLIEQGRKTLIDMGWIRLARWAERAMLEIL
ncbi:MAG TPA: toll/interleukin-1 receptor domain-containing protein [Thermodesulfovibrionales bacterium]|nr:toll/interleukin-1 receptor domain-containing protein [Thermodesulfovibrionales bacterium]